MYNYIIIEAYDLKDAKYWFKESNDDKVIVRIKRKDFSHYDEYDGKKIYSYYVYYKDRKR